MSHGCHRVKLLLATWGTFGTQILKPVQCILQFQVVITVSPQRARSFPSLTPPLTACHQLHPYACRGLLPHGQAYAVFRAPPMDVRRDWHLARTLGYDNAVLFALFNLMGVYPAITAALMLPAMQQPPGAVSC